MCKQQKNESQKLTHCFLVRKLISLKKYSPFAAITPNREAKETSIKECLYIFSKLVMHFNSIAVFNQCTPNFKKIPIYFKKRKAQRSFSNSAKIKKVPK